MSLEMSGLSCFLFEKIADRLAIRGTQGGVPDEESVLLLGCSHGKNT